MRVSAGWRSAVRLAVAALISAVCRWNAAGEQRRAERKRGPELQCPRAAAGKRSKTSGEDWRESSTNTPIYCKDGNTGSAMTDVSQRP